MLSRPLSVRDRRALAVLVQSQSSLGVSDEERHRLAAMGVLEERAGAPLRYELTGRGRRLLELLGLWGSAAVLACAAMGCDTEPFVWDAPMGAPEASPAADRDASPATGGDAGADTADGGSEASSTAERDAGTGDAGDARAAVDADAGAVDVVDAGPLETDADAGAPVVDAAPPPPDAGAPLYRCNVSALGAVMACAGGAFTCAADANGCSESCQVDADGGGQHCMTTCTGGLTSCAAPGACTLGGRCIVTTSDDQTLPGIVETAP